MLDAATVPPCSVHAEGPQSGKRRNGTKTTTVTVVKAWCAGNSGVNNESMCGGQTPNQTPRLVTVTIGGKRHIRAHKVVLTTVVHFPDMSQLQYISPPARCNHTRPLAQSSPFSPSLPFPFLFTPLPPLPFELRIS